MLMLLVLAPAASAQEKIDILVTGDKYALVNVPIVVPLSLDGAAAKFTTAQLSGPDLRLTGQLTAPGIVTDNIAPAKNSQVRRDLHFVLPRLGAREAVRLSCVLGNLSADVDRVFRWHPGKEYTDLRYGEGRSILRYMHRPYDDSSPDKRNLSYKVFHHLFDPAGKRLVTNGGHTNEDAASSKLLFPHHRGIQMGFSKTIYAGGKKRADTWHCQKDEHQSHQSFLNVEAGPVLGRHRVAVDWHGSKKEVIVKEERELTVYTIPGGTLVQFSSRLKPAAGTVKLDGDPQHAGFQFRAHNDVAAKTAKQTYYLRPDGKGEPGKTRNWPQVKTHVNLPWNAMSFVLDDRRYTVCYLDHPGNPRDSRHSERDYGRFGCYFEHDLTPEKPLVLNYRIWLQDGEMTLEQVQALSHAFTARPRATVQ